MSDYLYIDYSNAPAGTVVRYTVDGEIPTENSTLYNLPFPFTTGTIKARSFLNGYAASDVVEFTIEGLGAIKTFDNIETVCIYDAGSPQSWGQYIWMDKNHDLSYYIYGTDSIELNIGTETGKASQGLFTWGSLAEGSDSEELLESSQLIGEGLTNTNNIIKYNYIDDYKNDILWDKLKEFRMQYSDKWFIPTIGELKEVYKNKDFFRNLGNNNYYSYWSSSFYTDQNTGISSQSIYSLFMDFGSSWPLSSNSTLRARLCIYS